MVTIKINVVNPQKTDNSLTLPDDFLYNPKVLLGDCKLQPCAWSEPRQQGSNPPARKGTKG